MNSDTGAIQLNAAKCVLNKEFLLVALAIVHIGMPHALCIVIGVKWTIETACIKHQISITPI